jgi:hypothetical protein
MPCPLAPPGSSSPREADGVDGLAQQLEDALVEMAELGVLASALAGLLLGDDKDGVVVSALVLVNQARLDAARRRILLERELGSRLAG